MELVIFVLFGGIVWIDGVMDLVFYDVVVGEVWVFDWKMNWWRVGEIDEELLV